MNGNPKFRLTQPDPYELDIAAACADALDKLLLPPALWFAYPAGHVKLTGAQVARLARIGLKRSLPDLWILYHGVFLIELKTRSGHLSKTRVVRTRRGTPRVLIGQEDMFPKLLATGAINAIGTCRSRDEMIEQLANWQLPLRPGPYLSQFNLKSAQRMHVGEEKGLNG